MAEETKQTETRTGWRKAESLIFPVSAALVGTGYACAILFNNKIEKVFHSTYALVLLAAFCAIIFFSLRTLYLDVKGGFEDAL